MHHLRCLGTLVRITSSLQRALSIPAIPAMGEQPARVLMVNAGRIDFDRQCDLSKLEQVAEVVRHESDCDGDGIVSRAMECKPTVLITKEIPVPGDAVARLPSSVQMICEAGTGYNNVDLKAAHERGIAVSNVAGYSSQSVAQLVLTHILNFSCSLHLQYAALRAGDRESFEGKNPCGFERGMPHFELKGKTLGLIGGTGAIAMEVRRMALMMDMRVVVFSRSGLAPEGTTACDLKTLLSTSDFVSVHCPLKAETTGLIDAAALALMKKTAYLINTARGGVIQEEALIRALQEKKIAGAAIDVQGPPEPPIATSPLYNLENVVMTPHIGWKRNETRQRLVDLVAENIRSFLKGEPINIVGSTQ